MRHVYAIMLIILFLSPITFAQTPMEWILPTSKSFESGNGLPNEHTLQLKTGWNLISSPVFETVPMEFTDFQTTCDYTSPLWRFNANTQQYEQADYVTDAKEAFWIRVASDCTTTIDADGTYTP